MSENSNKNKAVKELSEKKLGRVSGGMVGVHEARAPEPRRLNKAEARVASRAHETEHTAPQGSAPVRDRFSSVGKHELAESLASRPELADLKAQHSQLKQDMADLEKHQMATVDLIMEQKGEGFDEHVGAMQDILTKAGVEHPTSEDGSFSWTQARDSLQAKVNHVATEAMKEHLREKIEQLPDGEIPSPKYVSSTIKFFAARQGISEELAGSAITERQEAVKKSFASEIAAARAAARAAEPMAPLLGNEPVDIKQFVVDLKGKINNRGGLNRTKKEWDRVKRAAFGAEYDINPNSWIFPDTRMALTGFKRWLVGPAKSPQLKEVLRYHNAYTNIKKMLEDKHTKHIEERTGHKLKKRMELEPAELEKRGEEAYKKITDRQIQNRDASGFKEGHTTGSLESDLELMFPAARQSKDLSILTAQAQAGDLIY